MNAFELFENLSLEPDRVTNPIINDLVEIVTTEDLVRVGRYLTDNLDHNHRIPTRDLHTTWGILDWYTEYRSLTVRQKWFLIRVLVHNWQYLTLTARSDLML